MFVGHIGIIATASQENLVSYPFWDISNPTGTTISNLNLTYYPSAENIQIDWGDGSIETINSDTNYNHTFI